MLVNIVVVGSSSLIFTVLTFKDMITDWLA